MKRSIVLGLVLTLGGFLLAQGVPGRFPKLTGAYLGQKPPGPTPELFAAGIVGTGLMERDVVVSPDGREIYYGLSVGNLMTILWTRLVDGRWTEPEIVPFAVDQAYFHFEPAMTADGRHMFFLSNRPPKGKEPKPGWTYQNIWAADRTANGSWGEPYEPDPAINAGATQFFPSLTNDGTIYFTRSDGQPRKIALWRSRLINGKYSEAEKLPDVINGQGTPYNACIAPDESYLVACIEGRPCDFNPGEANYFVFFRDKNDAWSEGIPLPPEVNLKGSTAMSPYVTRDGKYFFFAAQKTAERFGGSFKGRTLGQLLEMNDSVQNGNYDIYWVKAEVIEKLRPQEPTSSKPAGSVGPLTLTSIANSGALVACGGKKVLIDALFDHPNPEYRAPAPDVIEKMMKGTAPFDGVDLVLVTHNHPDHFDPALAVRYLEGRPDVHLLAPADAVAEMRKSSADWAKLEPRVISLDLKIGEKAERDIQGIKVTAYRTLHGESDSPMNLMYLFEIGGRRIFHEGDSSANREEWRRFGLGDAPIDLALVHFWFPFAPDQARLLQEDLKLAHIGLTHLPIKKEGEVPGMVDQVRQYYKDIFLMLPGLPTKVFAE